MSDSKSRELSSIESSFLYEKRIFRVDLKNLHALEVSDSFKFAVNSESFPKSYDKSNLANRNAFQGFFDSWGHFVVSSAYGGGSVEVKNSTTLTGNLAADLIEARGFMEASFGNISGGFGLSSGSNWGPQTSSKHSLSHLCWNGGDSHH